MDEKDVTREDSGEQIECIETSVKDLEEMVGRVRDIESERFISSAFL
jgi:hypothetical protein